VFTVAHWLVLHVVPMKCREDGGGGHCLVRMELRPAGWSVCLPLLVFPCTIKSTSSLLAPAHPCGPGKRAVKRSWWWWCVTSFAVACVVENGVLASKVLQEGSLLMDE